MLDIKFVRENAARVQKDAKSKGYKVKVSAVLALDEKRRELQGLVDELRAKRNDLAAQMKGGKPEAKLVEAGKNVKIELTKLENELRRTEVEFLNELKRLPNVLDASVPVGAEDQFTVVKEWGDKPKTAAVDHLDFAARRDWLDFERGAKVAGTKFYYLKNELALLENALYQFALQKLLDKKFVFMTVPHLVNGEVAAGTGFAPRSAEQSDEYFIENEDLTLIATAEIALTGYHKDEILDEKDLPLFYAGYSACYRKEAGAAGKHTRGLFRVHQFNKLEMYAFTTPEESWSVHEKLLAIEEEIWQELGVPYRVINIASEDLGSPAAKKYDLEYWSPVDGEYRELCSCSNCTDYQARNLDIRVRRADGRVEVLHTLNGTAVALARALVAILENYQNANGSLRVPEVLRPYLNGKEVL
jgi:seryl-tRNA synthetase